MNLKSSLKKTVTSELFFYTIIAFVSAMIFCTIYGKKVLNPSYTDWLMAGGDLSQHYLGWLSFRNSSWLFPLGMTKELSFPFATSMIFTDSIPLFALFFKLFSFLLPENFQYFGFWGIFCFVLQGIFAARILTLFVKDKCIIFLGAMFFVTAPVMIWRMYGHTALAGHWIILLSLYMFFAPEFSLKKNIVMWGIIGVLSPSIHTYFLGMNGIILLGFCLKMFLNTHDLKRTFLPLASYLVFALITIFLLGGFSTHTVEAHAGGLGFFSMNLNAFFNPHGWSGFLKDLPKGGGQYEGFAYLGFGALLLLFSSVFHFGFYENRGELKSTIKRYIPIVFVFLAAFLFAASNVVIFGEKTLFKIPLSAFLEKRWGIFRSSGRFSWICVYLLMLLPFYILRNIQKRKIVYVLISLTLFIQAKDLETTLRGKRKYFNKKAVYESTLRKSPEWNSIFSDSEIKHIFIQKSPDFLYDLTNEALKHKKTLNRFYFAHGKNELFDEKFYEFAKNPPESSVFLFLEEEESTAALYTFSYYYSIDKYIVASNSPIKNLKECKPERYNFRFQNKWLRNGKDENGVRILQKDGLSYGPYWKVPFGTYRVTISGEHLNSATISIYSGHGSDYESQSFTYNSTEDKIEIDLIVLTDVDDLEILIGNPTETEIVLKSLSMEIVE